MEQQLDQLAEVISTLDNLIAAMTLKMPADIHLRCLKESLPDVRQQLMTTYIELGGFDHWKEDWDES